MNPNSSERNPRSSLRTSFAIPITLVTCDSRAAFGTRKRKTSSGAEKPQDVAAEDQSLFLPRKLQEADLVELDARIDERPVGPEEELLRRQLARGLLEVVEEDDGRRLDVEIRNPLGRVDRRHVLLPVLRGEAPEMRKDEGDFRPRLGGPGEGGHLRPGAEAAGTGVGNENAD